MIKEEIYYKGGVDCLEDFEKPIQNPLRRH